MYNKAFTLVELAIVIVIIGLLVGGVLQGRELILQAQNRAIITELAKVNGAALTFMGKYKFLPGDLPNAQTVFDNTHVNGNANTLIDPATESLSFWTQLSASKIFPNSMTGVAIPSTRVAVGTNILQVKGFDRVGVLVYGPPAAGNDCGQDYWDFPTHFRGRNLVLFGRNPALYCKNYTGFLEADRAFSLDTKFDDGMPGTGRMAMNYYGSGQTGCYTPISSPQYYPPTPAATYNIASTTGICHLLFQADF